jgi:SpoVK/Ycf46/Vps4 family AAA+-type ATPase
LDLLLLDRPFIPEFSTEFPATRISTNRDWSELVLDDQTMAQVNEIKLWVKYGERIRKEWGLESRIKPGYRALFYGPSGSGKTFTATLLGKEVGKDVFCVDLSMVVSKFIGETEKNLSHVFEVAENKDWILFFDEADALFGKRTNVKDSHDRYANQEVAYLLQRVENYRGLVILSTNFKSNIDEAFARRFQVMVPFRMPEPEQRKRLWYDTFSSSVILEKDIDLNFISEEYELSGGSIVNVVQYCSLMAMSRGECIIRKDDIIEGIRKEFAKVGKILN